MKVLRQGSQIYVFMIVFLYSLLGSAEYRVFQLAISDTRSGSSRTVFSTLDDQQYPSYFYIRPYEQVSIQDMWFCHKRGDGFKPLCPNPKVAGNAPNPKANSEPEP